MFRYTGKFEKLKSEIFSFVGQLVQIIWFYKTLISAIVLDQAFSSPFLSLFPLLFVFKTPIHLFSRSPGQLSYMDQEKGEAGRHPN